MKIGKKIHNNLTARLINENIADKMWKTLKTNIDFNTCKDRPMWIKRDLLGITFNI